MMKAYLIRKLTLFIGILSFSVFAPLTAQDFSDPKELPDDLLISHPSPDTNYLFSFGYLNDDDLDDCVSFQIIDNEANNVHYQLNTTTQEDVSYGDPVPVVIDINSVPAILDVNNDDLNDLMLISGDLDHLSMRFLINHGSISEPAYSLNDDVKIDMSSTLDSDKESFPFRIDINGDKKDDMLIVEYEYYGSTDSFHIDVHYFENDGVNNEISFSYKGENLFGLNEVLNNENDLSTIFLNSLDVDGDNVNDIVYGAGGFVSPAIIKIAINEGTEGEADFNNSQTILESTVPKFYEQLYVESGDIDDDGDEDIIYNGFIINQEVAEIKYLENQTISSLPQTIIQEKEIDVYPNPASDQLVIKSQAFHSGNRLMISLVDTNGKKVLEKTTEWQDQMKLTIPASINSGSYILLITDGKKHARKKIQVVR